MSETLLTDRRYTRDDYRALPEGPPYYELIDGELIEMTQPFRSHQRVWLYLIEKLGPYVRHTLGGELAPEPNLYLPGTEAVYHPDLVYVAPDHLGIIEEDGIWGTPHVVCEILSPGTRRIDRHVKMQDYLRAGVPHVWLAEPSEPVSVEEYVLDGNRYRLHTMAETPSVWEPIAFPGWSISLAEVNAAVAGRHGSASRTGAEETPSDPKKDSAPGNSGE